MALFDNENVNVDVLKKRAFNYRWAEVPDGTIPLTAADPDYPVAPEIREAMMAYINDGYFSYTPKMGYPEFRESIARALYARKQEKIDPDLILPIDSAARGMYVIAETFLRPGDEMIVFDPVDYLFKESALAAGAVPVLFPAVLKDGHIDLSELEKYITPKTRMIGLCNPHNPYGVVYRKEDLEHIMGLCEKYGLYIMNDEIWSDIVFPEKPFISIYALGNERCRRVYSVFGFSKSFGIAGLRAGCVYCTDRDGFEKIVNKSAVLTTAGGIASISQIAGTACMDKCYYWVDEFLAHLKKNRDYALERLSSMPLITCHKPQATYLLFPCIKEFGMTSEEFTDYLKEKVQLALVSGGEQFFGPGSQGYCRICFATSAEILKEGLDRLEKGIHLLIQERNL
ncbi:pyridoxal phosphate-dependent aminotransferase [Lachnotalea sp. AF33-28]|jgi:aspartate/methionine/tyrosine aminotransferase|uniref:pyridoxal phosphate-dependent aminotransferase n=1 Tax=Lachnotalea sp. AF33-28 TaxID=2292046 RepID=UPI000E529C6C|nr:pyridoxal phosphate-dependent aminotransferase [Lachnotalea sp. AF33-28]RHP36418.1 pyridoxal phosphate-dependent aminotransferase [Lachnotalea sp. AF33-28]